MKRFPLPLLFLGMAVTIVPSAFGQPANPDIGGTWRLNASIFLMGEESPCEYQGDLPLTQDTKSWEGPADLMLLSGPQACPGEMTGDLTGMLSPGELAGVTQITGAISGADPMGYATFGGVITSGPMPEGARAPARPAGVGARPDAEDTFQGEGDLTVEEGSFAGLAGTWSAMRLARSVLQIPALTPVGLTVLVLLVLAAGALLLRRRHGAA